MSIPLQVSICLPTCNRPELIVQCIDSCLDQRYGHFEIVIGDDSADERTLQLIAERYANEPRIRYQRNQPPLGQARNVASLFERAVGDKILLIHDDDCLAPDGIEKLVSLWALHPALEVAFADQYEMDHTGTVDLDASARLNAAFRRVKSAEGLQALPGRAGLIQMFPNNGWMANADLVKRISYREQYGMCCDFVFGTELCLAASQVFYLNEYVSLYRKTATSISHSTRGSTLAATVTAYGFVEALSLPPQLEAARKLALRRLVPIVVSVYARNREPLLSLRIALAHLSAYQYGLNMRLYYHLLMVSRALLAMRVSRGLAAAGLQVTQVTQVTHATAATSVASTAVVDPVTAVDQTELI